MAAPLPARVDVRVLHARLRAQLASAQPRTVADVLRVFLDVSSLAVEKGLFSLEFAFDEDDGRVARLEARFVEGDPLEDELPGYEVLVLLPRLLPPAPAEVSALATTDGDESLVARFLRALADLGAYRTIEALEPRSVDTLLL